MTVEEPKPETPITEGAAVKPPLVLQAAKAADIRNPWMCIGCGAILGSVFHEKVRQGLSYPRLILFRGAVMVHEYLPANFVFAKLDAGEVVCSRCGTIRTWHPSPECVKHFSENGHAKKKNRNL